MSEPSRTALTSYHESVGARLVDFAGWQMPIQYESIMQEHQATRTAVGLFDISHMGRIDFQGSDAASFLETVVTRRVCELSPGLVRYSLICNEEGGILDDVLIYRYDDGDEVLSVGTRVFHQKFGYGRITAKDGGKLDIAFEKAGSKKVMASFVEAV